MAYQGYNSPNVVVNDASFGTRAWGEPELAKTSNDQWAHRATLKLPGTNTNYLKATDFGFSIPLDATIDGIIGRVERHCSTADGCYTVRLRAVKGGVVQSTDMDSGDSWPGSDTSISYGGSTNKWGTTWTPAQINASNFGFVVACNLNVGIARVDWMNVRVYYTPYAPPTIPSKVNISDTFRQISEYKVNVGDSWRAVVQIKINIGDSWRAVWDY